MPEDVSSGTKVSGEVAVNTKAAEAALSRLHQKAKATAAELRSLPKSGTVPNFPSETGLTPVPTLRSGVGSSVIAPTPPRLGETVTSTPPAQNPQPPKNAKPVGIKYPNRPNPVARPKSVGFADSDLRKRFFAVEQGGGKFAGFNVGPGGLTLDRGAFLGLAGRSVGLFFAAAGLGKVAETLSTAGREAIKEALEGDMPFHVALGLKANKVAADALETLGEKASSAVKWIPSVGHSVAQLVSQGWGSVESAFGNAFGWDDEDNKNHLRELENKFYAMEDSWQELVGGETRAQRFDKSMARWAKAKDKALMEATKKAREMTTQLGEKLQGFGFRGTLGEIEGDLGKQVEEFQKAKTIEDFLKKNPIPTYDAADVTVDDGSE